MPPTPKRIKVERGRFGSGVRERDVGLRSLVATALKGGIRSLAQCRRQGKRRVYERDATSVCESYIVEITFGNSTHGIKVERRGKETFEKKKKIKIKKEENQLPFLSASYFRKGSGYLSATLSSSLLCLCIVSSCSAHKTLLLQQKNLRRKGKDRNAYKCHCPPIASSSKVRKTRRRVRGTKETPPSSIHPSIHSLLSPTFHHYPPAE